MSIKPKTISDFNKAVLEAKQEFLNEKINYNWEYTIKEEKLEGLQLFWICNTQNARKIVFHEEMKTVIDRRLYMSDVKILSEMKGELK
jgi:hypothetical protein